MKKKLFTSAALMVAMLTLAGCTTFSDSDNTEQGLVDGPNVIRVLAGSEVKDMAPIIADVEKNTGVKLVFEYTGTLEGTQQVASGSVNGKYDATWFPSNRYLNLLEGGTQAVSKETKIMSSPVVLGVKQDVAASLGWDTVTPTWNDIVEAVRSGDLKYGMTSPVSSNSGFATLIEAATALSGTGNALTVDDITKVTPVLQEFFKGQSVTSGSSGWLAEKFVEAPEQADAIFNYESVLTSMKVDGKPLTIVIPSDGVITADYPLTLLKSAATEKEALYDKVVEYLTTDAVQTKINSVTSRRTSTSVQNTTATVFELPFPNQLETVQALISAYLSEIKKPSDILFTVDTSGSMGGERIDQLKDALAFMVDTTGENVFTSFQNRESVTYVEFADSIKAEKFYAIEEGTRTKDLAEIKTYIDSLQANGGTAVYDSLKTSYQKAAVLKNQNPDHFVSVVLFTDGESTDGASYEDFVVWFNKEAKTNENLKTIPTFVIQFGESNPDELEGIATLTGGKMFGSSDSNLTSVFKEIRGYQ